MNKIYKNYLGRLNLEEDKSMEMLFKGIRNITSSPLFASESNKNDHKSENVPDNIFSRQINALMAAIPFLDSEYQRGIFILVKFLEYKRFMEERHLVSAQNTNDTDNFTRMAAAIRMNLNDDEKRSFDNFYRILAMRKFMGGKYGL